MAPLVKVCGLTEAARVDQAAALGAAFAGFVFYPPSARSLRPDLAAGLVARLPAHVTSVGVTVDPSDAELDAILAEVPLDVIQLHGAETPERVAAVALRTGCRVMKAIRVEAADDLATLDAFAAVADLLLFDAKPPRRPDAIPGGNGVAFDWAILAGLQVGRPWALAGGLTAENVTAAVARVAPPIVDVSSGVELRPGVKDPVRLDAFFTALRSSCPGQASR